MAIIIAFTTIGAATAWAAPEWKQGGGAIPLGLEFNGEFGAANLVPKIRDGKYSIECTSGRDIGSIRAPNIVRTILLNMKGCAGENTENATSCVVNSEAQAAGTIQTQFLEGELKEVEMAEAGSERGVLLKAAVPPVVTLEITCIPEVTTTRTITGEVVVELRKPKEERKFLNFLFAVSGGKQKIQHIKEALPPVQRVLKDGTTEVTLKTENEFEVKVFKIGPCGGEKAEDIEAT